MPQPDEIADPTYRQEMEDANAALNDGRYLEAVRRCADAYLSMLQTRPIAADEAEMTAAARWPRLGVRLVLDNPRMPSMVWDRERFSFAEAITYYEFTLEQLIRLTAPAG
jgi:hypothetical protein